MRSRLRKDRFISLDSKTKQNEYGGGVAYAHLSTGVIAYNASCREYVYKKR